MPFTILIVMDNHSHLFDNALTNKLVEKFSDDVSFLFTSISKENIAGYINKEVWEFINTPKANPILADNRINKNV